MTLNFPSNPIVGQATSIGAKTWKWNGEGWELVPNLVVAAQGIQGIQGNQGNQGNQGLQGSLSNFQGTQGTQGLQGNQGVQGVQSIQGAQGNQGLQGDQGLQGLQGILGSQGSQGTQGLQGDLGTQGTQGIQGLSNQGVQGTQGNQGLQGLGDQGIQGLQGLNGEYAGQGLQGTQGTQGVQGLRGDQGTQGTQGVQGSLSNFQGTQGTQGNQGLQGDQGTQGLQGLSNQGVQGLQGNQGNQGLQGTQGLQGLSNQGVQGLQGVPGTGGSESYWEKTSVGINTVSNVGIGTTNSTDKLTVRGNISLYDPSYTVLNVGGNTSSSNSTSTADIIFRGTQFGSPAYIRSSGGTFEFKGNESGTQIVFGSYIIGAVRQNNDRLKIDGIEGDVQVLNITNSTSETTGALQVRGGVGIKSDLYVKQNAVINGNLGIGSTTPTSKLQVERYGVTTGFGTFNASVGIATDIDTFSVSVTDFKTVEYTLHFIRAGNIQAQKVLVMQNGTTAYSQEYAIMFDPNQIVSIGATISSGICKLQVTPETGITGLTTFRFMREIML